MTTAPETLYQLREALKENEKLGSSNFDKRTFKHRGRRFFEVTSNEFILEKRLKKIVKVFPLDAPLVFFGGSMSFTLASGKAKGRYHFVTISRDDFAQFDKLAERIEEQ